MTKHMKFDATGDSDDLQALFDSMAGVPAEKPRLQIIDASAADGDDSDDLQALFDSVAGSFGDLAPGEPVAHADVSQVGEAAAGATATSAPPVAGTQSDAMFQKIGQMTRQVHDSLRELGYDSALQQAAEAIPDAREHLAYIAQMAEQAASRVLNATDIAMPLQARVTESADALRTQWDQAFANALSVEQFKELAGATRQFLAAATDDSRSTHAQLTEIMMAQNFQDLTGQVIKKVVVLAQTLEAQLLEVLIETAPEGKKPVRKEDSLLNGPVIQSGGRDDVVSSQTQVDDLLESLGF